MGFSNPTRIKALIAAQRCCCVCHVQCGINIECHHIVPEAEGGSNALENCIPLCFNHHADVMHYNDQHPRGTKFSAEELRKHRDAWFEKVKNSRALPLPPAANEIDRAIFRDLRAKLPENLVRSLEIMTRVSRQSQASSIRRIFDFAEWGSSLSNEFIDADLDAWRAELVQTARAFGEAKYVLDNLRLNYPNDLDTIRDCVRDMNPTRRRIEELYESIVRTCRQRFGVR